MVKESITVHHVLPHVDFLANEVREFELCLILDQLWVEEALRNLDMSLVLDEHVKSSVSLWNSRWTSDLEVTTGDPEVWYSRNKTNQCFLRADDFLDEA